MPLHDWADLPGWEGVHLLWIAELFHWAKPRLPEGYRAYLGTAPLLAVGTPGGKPDIRVRTWSGAGQTPGTLAPTEADAGDYDVEVAVSAIDPGTALFIERHGALVAALELVSPRNKDRPSARNSAVSHYLGCVLNGANLVLIDVHPRPLGFSFADRIDEELGREADRFPAPVAASYRVGDPAPEGGRLVAMKKQALGIGRALPTMPLPLAVGLSVPLDLETTYARAAADAYLP